MNRSFRVKMLVAVCLTLLAASFAGRRVQAGWFRALRREPPLCCRYFYLEPKNVPKGTKVPVVLFLHGAGGVTLGPPQPDTEMFVRMVQQGYLVLVPLFQEGNEIYPYHWHPAAICGYKSALAEVKARGRVVPDTQRLAIVGHSMGGLFALRTAALAAQRGDMPAPRAIIMQDAAGYTFAPYFTNRIRDVRRWCYTTAPFDNFSSIADDTLLVALMAEETWKQDRIDEPADGDAVDFGNSIAGGVVSRGWHTTGIRPDKRFLIIVRGDKSRQPPLVSDHRAIDLNLKNDVGRNFWRVTEAALAQAFADKPADFSEQLSRTWADGSPQLIAVQDVPKPTPFVWDCQSMLGYTRHIRLFLPRRACPRW
jgi:pimeloyl-ACP methyl ester carboxylesterase